MNATLVQLDGHVHELARSLHLVEELDHNAKSLSKKVVGEWDFTSSRMFAVVLVQLEMIDEDNASTMSDLLLLRSEEKEWFKVVCNGFVHDIAFHKDKFYVFFLDWKVGVINPGKSLILNLFMTGPDILPGGWSNLFLNFSGYPTCIKVDGIIDRIWCIKFVPSKSNSCLYVFIRACGGDMDMFENEETDFLYVFLMKDLESKWERVVNLGDEIFFIGDFVSFAFPDYAVTVNLAGRILDSICHIFAPYNFFKLIYYGQSRNTQMPKGTDCLKHLSYPPYDKFIQFSRMEQNGVIRFKEMREQDQDVYAQLFFPPRAWVKWCCPSLDNVEVRLDGLPFRHDDDDDDDFDFGYNDDCI